MTSKPARTSKPVRTSKPSRIASVDMLRGASMIMLVLVHSVAYLARTPQGFDPTYQFFGWVLGGTGAALFTSLVGASFVLSMRALADLPGRVIILGAIARGVFLIALSMCINVLTKGVDHLFVSQILQLIGVASIVVALLRKAPSWVLLTTAVAVCAVAPLVRSALGFEEWWGGQMVVFTGAPPQGLIVVPIGELAPGIDLRAALATALVAGVFPILPWLAFPLLGMVLGRQLAAHRPQLGVRWTAIGGLFGIAGLGLALYAASAGLTDVVASHLTPLAFWPDSTTMLLLQTGVVLVAMGISHAALDHHAEHGPWLDVVKLYSRYALTVYTTSWLVIFIPIHLADFLAPGRHVSDLTGTYPALAFGILLVIAYYPVLRFWDRHGGVGSMEWAMRRLQGGVGRPSTRV